LFGELILIGGKLGLLLTSYALYTHLTI